MLDYQTLKRVMLFEGFDEKGIEHVLTCLGANSQDYATGSYALFTGEPVTRLGIVEKGSLNISSEDEDGVRTIIANVGSGDIFAEALCCANVLHSPVSVQAVKDSTVIWLEFHRIMQICPNTCTFHMQIIERMVRVIARKNLTLQSRVALLSAKTIRERVIRHLKAQMTEQGQEINLPFNREEMADFLCVDRSALSRELSKLRDEGLITYDKNRFNWMGRWKG